MHNVDFVWTNNTNVSLCSVCTYLMLLLPHIKDT